MDELDAYCLELAEFGELLFEELVEGRGGEEGLDQGLALED